MPLSECPDSGALHDDHRDVPLDPTSAGVALNGDQVTVYDWYLDSTTHREVFSDNLVYLTITC